MDFQKHFVNLAWNIIILVSEEHLKQHNIRTGDGKRQKYKKRIV